MGKPSKNSTPNSYDAAQAAIERLFYSHHFNREEVYRDNAAAIFSTVVHARAIDRQTKAIEAQTAALEKWFSLIIDEKRGDER